ncbi:MAG: hypothetical protein P4N24_08315 [Acidobacteriota bacterium]|jgi:hypothetical protein|nr:hypothetical protein [Acidobacteriota bacterium]
MRRRTSALVLFLVSCAFSFLAAAGLPAQAAEHISGEWKINANNYNGKLQLSGDDGAYTGRAYIEGTNHWENLTNIRFEPRSRRIEFDRPEANQHYVGRLVRDDRMEGTFAGNYTWWAERTGGGGREEGDNHERSAINGQWKINGNNYTGKMEFSGGDGQYSGRVFYDVTNRWENLTNIRFEPRSRRIEFDRPEYNQHYVGRLVRDDRMEGTFAGNYTWFAER